MEHIKIFESTNLSIKSLRGKSRLPKVVKARKIICYLLNKQGMKQKDIAPIINYSRSGVKYMIGSLKVEMSVNNDLQNEINSLENQYITKKINK